MSCSHWRHFLAIEAHLDSTTPFVEFHEKNFKTFSVEFSRVLLSAASEVDVVCKLLCARLDPGAPRSDMDEYRSVITTGYPKLHTIEVLVPRYSMRRKPWSAWGFGHNPHWWQSHNNVKHQRDQRYHEANLKHALDAVAGLFALVLYLHEGKDDELTNRPRLVDTEIGPGYLKLERGYGLPDFPQA